MRTLIDIIAVAVTLYSIAGLGMLWDHFWPPKKEPRNYSSRRNDP